MGGRASSLIGPQMKPMDDNNTMSTGEHQLQFDQIMDKPEDAAGLPGEGDHGIDQDAGDPEIDLKRKITAFEDDSKKVAKTNGDKSEALDPDEDCTKVTPHENLDICPHAAKDDGHEDLLGGRECLLQGNNNDGQEYDGLSIQGIDEDDEKDSTHQHLKINGSKAAGSHGHVGPNKWAWPESQDDDDTQGVVNDEKKSALHKNPDHDNLGSPNIVDLTGDESLVDSSEKNGGQLVSNGSDSLSLGHCTATSSSDNPSEVKAATAGSNSGGADDLLDQSNVCDLTMSCDEASDEDSVIEMYTVFKGRHNTTCSVCSASGDLICCSFCQRGFHFKCHDPPVSSAPSRQWRCNECSAAYDLSLSLPEKRRKKLGFLFRYNLRDRSQQDTASPSLGDSAKSDSPVAKVFCRRKVTPQKNKHIEGVNLFEGEHSDECFICEDGGDLVLCSFCEKSYHQECHIPPLKEVPHGDWKCCECLAPELTRRYKCGECTACLKKQCGQCKFCRDSKKFGGPGILKQVCIEKRCPNKRYALPATVALVPGVIHEERETVFQDGGGGGNNAQAFTHSMTQNQDDSSTGEESDSSKDEISMSADDGEGLSAGGEGNENEDECYMCGDGGELLMCDFCNKSFHMECHIPRMNQVPAGEWKCCECSAVERTEKSVCGECDDCVQPDCGQCGPCVDREIPGLDNTGVCELKKCQFMRYAPPEVHGVDKRTKPVKYGRRHQYNPKKKGKNRTRHQRKGNQKQRKRQTKPRPRPAHNCNIVDSPFQTSSSSDDSRISVGGLKVMSISMGSKKKQPNCFEEFFANRTLEVKVPINETPPERTFWHDGRHWVLVSAKVPNKNRGFFEVKEINLQYIAIEGTNLPRIDLQMKLDNLCSFSTLKAIKTCSRLSHLQSEVRQIFYVQFSSIEFIDENWNEGCGFFPRNFFDGVISRRSYDSIQVRFVGPRIGLVKGMLLAKDRITKLQVPPSMVKVNPSKTSDENWVAIIIKNIYPSVSNIHLGKHLNPDDDPCKSWKRSSQKELSEMHQRMLVGYGVKKKDVDEYAKLSKNPENLNHAHLKGAADPTLKIPEGKVFISGYVTDGEGQQVLFGKRFKHIYCSRSPAVSPHDAKILTVIAEKTEDMSDDEWRLLCSYKWGTILFGTPRKRKSSALPCIIADGDLDGDDYFICWNDQIITHLLHAKDKLTSKSRKLLLELKLPKVTGTRAVDKTNASSHGGGENWLSLSQDKMLDFASQNAEGKITGKLYKLAFEASKKAGGKIDIYDEDACAYAQAYKDALDIQKHGGKIFLPEHLHDSIPVSLRTLLL